MSKRADPKREQGQVIVLFALAIVVIMGFAALAIDVSVLRNANQNLWNALDAGALAGASQLPASASNAEDLARQYADINYPGGIPPDVTVDFRCLIGSVAGAPRLTDVPAVCNPGVAAVWTCNATICTSICVPTGGNLCNTIVLQGDVNVPYGFGGAVGVNSGTTQTVTSAACKGPCGIAPATPVDIVVVVDRTSSMNGVDTENARSAADAVRTGYNPAEQWMAFGMLGPSQIGSPCLTQPAATIGTAMLPTDLRRWVPVGLSGTGAPVNEDYTLPGSTFGKAVACFTNSSTQTDLNDPINTAAYELLNHGRPGATKAILLMTDGQPNTSTLPGPNYCALSDSAATAAKASGIEIFTIGFGLDGANNILCPDTSGVWQGQRARALLASMATNSVDNDCPGTSNTDGDHFYCVPKTAGASTSLAALFTDAITTLTGPSKLVQLP